MVKANCQSRGYSLKQHVLWILLLLPVGANAQRSRTNFAADISLSWFAPLAPYFEVGIDTKLYKGFALTGGIEYSEQVLDYSSGQAEGSDYTEYNTLTTWGGRLGLLLIPDSGFMPAFEIGILGAFKVSYTSTRNGESYAPDAPPSHFLDPYFMVGLSIPISGILLLPHFMFIETTTPWYKDREEVLPSIGCRMRIPLDSQ